MEGQSTDFRRPDIARWFRAYSDQMHNDRYPFYHYLLEEEPLYFLAQRNFWVISRYEGVTRILKDPSFVVDYRNAMPKYKFSPLESKWKHLNYVTEKWMPKSDAPVHTSLRRAVGNYFSPKLLAQFKTKIIKIAEDLIDQMEKDSRAELITSFALPLPIIVIAELLGVPAEDHVLFKKWSHTLLNLLEGLDQSPEFMKVANRAAEEMTEYFEKMIAERKTVLREDLISQLYAAEELTVQEIIGVCTFLLAAGHETTVNLIGNGIRTLLNHPEQLDQLRNKKELITSTIEEILRFESPVQLTTRFASVDYEMNGRLIRQGQQVNLLLAAANRDPAKFRFPDRFDISRSPNPHLAFSSGSHYCLGASLARLEGEIAFSKLIKRFPNMNLADSRPDWNSFILFRGLKSLYLHL